MLTRSVLLGATLFLAACSGETTPSENQAENSDAATEAAQTASAEAAAPAASSIMTPAHVSEEGFQLIKLAGGLGFPWGMAELPNGDLLVTEREGLLRRITDDALVDAPLQGLPEDILVDGQGGLLGIALDPDFASNRTLYISYAKDMGDNNTTAVSSAVLSDDMRRLTNVTEIFLAETRDTAFHFGGRLDFLPDGTLLVGLGDGGGYKELAQDPSVLHGKIARINTDGSLPADNPFADGGGHPAVYSYGHRNVQGLVRDDARGITYAHEHGPKGGDELNVIEPGNNYGWPTITYGVNYDGTIITDQTEAPGMEQPVVKWVPSIAPSGMTLVNTPGFEAWQGDLLIGGMSGPAGQKLVRVDLDDAGNVVGTEDLLVDLELAYRDVLSTPNAIYLADKDINGAVYRLETVE